MNPALNHPSLQINLLAAWIGILLGFVSGMVLGMFFHGENWLGGYASLKRRMYRLGHISLFGLGAVNLFFWLTARHLPTSSPLVTWASWAFVVGAVTMPLCCVVMAHFPKLHLIFTVPVVSLMAGGALTVIVLVWPDVWEETRAGLTAAQIQSVQASQYWAVDYAPPGPWMLNSY